MKKPKHELSAALRWEHAYRYRENNNYGNEI